MDLFGTKTLLKTYLKHLRKSEIFACKILVKTPKKWGIYRPLQNIAVRLICQPDRLGGRAGRPPTVINMTVGAARSTAQIQRAELSGPVDRPAHCASRRAQVCARRSTGSWLGRPCGRPTWPVSTVLGQKLGQKNMLKIF